MQVHFSMKIALSARHNRFRGCAKDRYHLLSVHLLTPSPFVPYLKTIHRNENRQQVESSSRYTSVLNAIVLPSDPSQYPTPNKIPSVLQPYQWQHLIFYPSRVLADTTA